MQLKQLKLSGFKSFVDPTVVPFSSQLVAVVGPNGCGKSNIIDAVRWVMGEGSAKTLRGESMTDVIFNGSSGRKSVGQASVELVFDNSLGRFSGQYASYQEISIKRSVSRDGSSGYFLNGTRCRRRDITDLFLGTGAGTRGYSIIGQNTISQIVEAKPEDLRAYLEEAAGVSKYKERRRETLQRIHQTRDNLSRVHDISKELESQLSRLERQAKAAERYQILKKEERQYKRDIQALKWQSLTQEQEKKRLELSQLTLTHEHQQAEIAALIKAIALIDNQVLETQQNYQTAQTQYYQMANEVARLQELQQQKLRDIQQLVADRAQVEADIQTVVSQLEQDVIAHKVSQDEHAVFLQRLEVLRASYEEASQALQEKQQHALVWGQKKEKLQALLNQAQRDKQIHILNQQHLESRYHDTLLRLDKIQLEREQYQAAGEQEVLENLRQQQVVANNAYQQAVDKQHVLTQQGQVLSEQIRQTELELRAAQDHAQSIKVEHAALQASLQATLKEMGSGVSEPGSDVQRLVELIEVDEPWRAACEWVLGDSLHAIALESLDALLPSLTTLIGQPMVWVTPAHGSVDTGIATRLSEKVQGFKPSWLYPLERIFVAHSIEEALSLLPRLSAEESVITADGLWFGKGWLRIADFNACDEQSLLLRQKRLGELQVAVKMAEERIAELSQARDSLHELQTAHLQEEHAAKLAWAECQQALQTINTQYHQKQHAIEQASLHLNRLQREFDELQVVLEEFAADRLRLESALTQSTQQILHDEQQWSILMAEKSEWEDALNISKAKAEDIRAALHDVELQCHREQLKVQQLEATIAREQARKDTLTLRLEALNQRYLKIDVPDEDAKIALMQAMEKHQHFEQELNQARDKLDALQLQVREMQQFKLQSEKKGSEIQEQIHKTQLAEQSLVARIEAIVESLLELEVDPATCLEQCLPEMTIEHREMQLLDITDKIKRLGAINLIAIEEYQTELARKTHLDNQSQDLQEALLMLESAIAKMDAETQLRLQDTFSQVNTLFQALFPRLFGGGNARLELTCDNLLEAGVLVMAQPPGKRNSSIHLLSGGEKAMTAVALVFAIFQLNPSPFCMLDEVDAPLDDLNVGRFCDLVKEMSQYVQFLLITHNKVTMELAEHLIGVTMREPGVSRIVSVDVADALSLVETA